ncbi:16S rRNA (cytidine(1402)-2'-O)-methyltransferase [soil metagenome]
MPETALYLVATPIGDDGDLSPRGTRLLLEAKLVIGEEFRPLTTILKRIGRPRVTPDPKVRPPELPDLEVLNEHSKPEDVKYLADRVIAIHKAGGFTALVSDCGTPGFCDPGAPLVAELRRRGYTSSAAPGASALMCLLSVAGTRLDQFVFRGFLPASRDEREVSLKDLARETRALVVMDTPYRLEKLLGELATAVPNRQATLGCDFTSEKERIYQGTVPELVKIWNEKPADERKAEFMILLHPLAAAASNVRK